jgi:hypothetical protein
MFLIPMTFENLDSPDMMLTASLSTVMSFSTWGNSTV